MANRCPLWVISGHDLIKSRCPLYPQKQTSPEHTLMSAKCQKQTSANSVDHATKAMAALTMAVANGELTQSEAGELSRVIEGYVKAVEATEIERRLRLLEERAIRDAK